MSALVASLALAGCSSSAKSASGGGGSTTEASSSSAPVASGTPADSSKSAVKIGILVTLTGTNSSDQGQPVLNVAEAWVDWVNKTQDGINGHPVKLFSENTQATPAAAAAAAAKLVQDGVVAAIGNADGQDEAIYAKPLVDAKIPVIGGAIIGDSVVTSSPYVYGYGAGAVPGLKLSADVAKVEGAKNMGTVLCNSAPTCSGASDIISGEAKNIGLTYSGFVGVADGAPNYDAACLTLKQKGVDYVFLGVAAEDVPRIVSDCAQQGYKPQYGNSFSSAEGSVLDPLAKQFGVSFSGVLPSFQWFGTSAPIKLYQQVVTQFGPAHSVFEDAAPTATWTGFELFRKAMTQAASSLPDPITAADVQTAMQNIQNEDLDGLLPQKLSWGGGKSSVDPTCAWGYKNTNGVFTGDAAPICLAPGA
jgi:branched-chain amino acid transport system substrate-binding protein